MVVALSVRVRSSAKTSVGQRYGGGGWKVIAPVFHALRREEVLARILMG